MKKLLSTVITIMLLITLLPIYALAANNGPGVVEFAGEKYYEAYIIIGDNENSKAIFLDSSSGGTIDNKAISGVTYDKKTNTLTLKNYKQPTKSIEANLMGEDFKIKLEGTNQINQLTVWGYQWGGSIQFTGSGSIEINKNKNYNNAVTMEAEKSNAVFKVAKTATVKLWAKKNLINITMSKVSSAAKTVVLANGQNISAKKSQSYDESYEWIQFKVDEGNYGTSPVYVDNKGTKYVIFDYYEVEPTQIYLLGSKGSDGYYTGTKSNVAYSSLTRLINKQKVSGCYNYIVSGTSLTIPAGSSDTTTIKKLNAKSKAFKATWKKKSVTGYQIEYSTSSKFTNSKTVTIKKAKTVSTTIKKLKAKKKYHVRIRTYKTLSGQKLYSSWSKAKTVKTKK